MKTFALIDYHVCVICLRFFVIDVVFGSDFNHEKIFFLILIPKDATNNITNKIITKRPVKRFVFLR